MDSKDINRFSIREYLAGMNIHPAKDKNSYGMYYSPFREDKDASMKVDYNKNLWIDYGTNEGGTLIDLVMRMKNCTNGEAMQLLEQQLSGKSTFSFQGNTNPSERKECSESAIQITKVTSLSTPALLDYLKERKIDIELAKLYCKEVKYSVNDKPYYAIGFSNDVGGYVLRSKYFKGCTSNAITHLKNGSDNCLLFEGFMDFLSYLTLKKNRIPEHSAIVLNSVSNLSKAQDVLSKYCTIFSCLDNDESGKRAVRDLQSFCKDVKDQSVHYAKYKDLNDYLCNRFEQKLAIKKKPNRGMKM